MISHEHNLSVTDQDKQTSPADSVTLTVSTAETNPHTHKLNFTQPIKASSVSGAAQTDMQWWANPRGAMICRQDRDDFTQTVLAWYSPTNSHHKQAEVTQRSSHPQYCETRHWSSRTSNLTQMQQLRFCWYHALLITKATVYDLFSPAVVLRMYMLGSHSTLHKKNWQLSINRPHP